MKLCTSMGGCHKDVVLHLCCSNRLRKEAKKEIESLRRMSPASSTWMAIDTIELQPHHWIKLQEVAWRRPANREDECERSTHTDCDNTFHHSKEGLYG